MKRTAGSEACKRLEVLIESFVCLLLDVAYSFLQAIGLLSGKVFLQERLVKVLPSFDTPGWKVVIPIIRGIFECEAECPHLDLFFGNVGRLHAHTHGMELPKVFDGVFTT